MDRSPFRPPRLRRLALRHRPHFCFVAKESVVSTLEVLLGGAAVTGMFSPRAAISFLVFTLLYTPCVAAIATIRRELGSTVKTVGVVILQCGVAWLVGWLAYAITGLF